MAKVLGIDFGKSRIGVALGENPFFAPFAILEGKNWNEVLRVLKKIIEENEISCIVLGTPKKDIIGANSFKEFLKEQISIPIRGLNEDFTSKEALDYSIKMGYSKKSRKHLDDVAACMLLEKFFENYDCKDKS